MGRCNPLIERFPESRSGPKSDKVGEHPCFKPSRVTKFKQVNEHANKVTGWRPLHNGEELERTGKSPGSYAQKDIATTLQESLKFNVWTKCHAVTDAQSYLRIEKGLTAHGRILVAAGFRIRQAGLAAGGLGPG